MRSRTITAAALWGAALLVCATVSLAGGLAGVLEEVGSEPNADDRPEAPAIGLPADVTPTTAPAVKRDPRAELQARIDALRRQIEEMKKLRPETIRPVNGLGEAEAEVRRLEEALAKAKADLMTADKDAAARLAKRKSDFDAKYAPLAEAIETAQKPADMSPLDWAHRCDEYFRDKADYDGDLTETKARLQSQIDRKLAHLTAAVQGAGELADRVRGLRSVMTPGERQFMDRMIAWKAHQAKLLAAQETLRDLLKLQADLEGATELRGDPIEAEAVEQTGFLLADALCRLVLRELSLAEATPLPSPADLDKGLGLPEWMTIMNPRARAKARHRYALEQLRLAEQALAELDRAIQDQDEGELNFLRQIGFSEADLRQHAQALAKTRHARMLAREEELFKSRDHWRDEVAEDAAALEKLTPPPATSQAAETP